LTDPTSISNSDLTPGSGSLHTSNVQQPNPTGSDPGNTQRGSLNLVGDPTHPTVALHTH
jgi:hypothetical protein